MPLRLGQSSKEIRLKTSLPFEHCPASTPKPIISIFLCQILTKLGFSSVIPSDGATVRFFLSKNKHYSVGEKLRFLAKMVNFFNISKYFSCNYVELVLDEWICENIIYSF